MSNRYSILLILFLSLVCAPAFAEKGGITSPMMDKQHDQTMSRQHATQKSMTQMMNRDQLRNMAQLMDQMQNTMSSMTQLMEQHRMMNQTQLSEVAGVMQHLSQNMQKMSQDMDKGDYDDKTLSMLRDQTKDMDQTLDRIRDQLHK